jgi:hypothetical protein
VLGEEVINFIDSLIPPLFAHASQIVCIRALRELVLTSPETITDSEMLIAHILTAIQEAPPDYSPDFVELLSGDSRTLRSHQQETF